MDQTPTTAPEPAACPACGYPGLILTYTPAGDAYACTLQGCSYVHHVTPDPKD